MNYTVESFAPTGKVDPTYGTEYIVKFNEDPRQVKLSRKKEVVVGQQENGTISDSPYGARFKKDPFVPGQSSPSPSQTPAQTPVFSGGSDGARQGMCINNAANYVNANPVAYTADVWAENVHKFASALYALGDLTAEEPSLLDSVAEVFNTK